MENAILQCIKKSYIAAVFYLFCIAWKASAGTPSDGGGGGGGGG